MLSYLNLTAMGVRLPTVSNSLDLQYFVNSVLVTSKKPKAPPVSNKNHKNNNTNRKNRDRYDSLYNSVFMYTTHNVI